MTPRKTQRRNQNNISQPRPVIVQASDYDTDAYYTAPTQARTAAEINFSVVKRYVPSLHTILALAPSAQIYTFSPEESKWNKADIEGTLFVCQLTASPVTGEDRHCIIVLNRKGLDNLIIESGEIESVEITDEFLLMGFQSKATTETKTLGFYIQTSVYSREQICGLIKEHWEAAMRERAQAAQEGMSEAFEEDVMESIEGNGEYQPMGRRLSLTELFGQR